MMKLNKKTKKGLKIPKEPIKKSHKLATTKHISLRELNVSGHVFFFHLKGIFYCQCRSNPRLQAQPAH
jgi:hypothetical protein